MSSFWVNITAKDGKGVITSSHFDAIREYHSCENPKIKYASPWAKRHIPNRVYFIGTDGVFEVGLLESIFGFCKKINEEIDSDGSFVVDHLADSLNEPAFPLKAGFQLHQFDGFEYRDVQEESILHAIKRGRGIIDVGTAGGKGLVFASIIRTLLTYNPHMTFALIVPTHLVSKTLTEMINEYGFDADTEITAWSGKIKPDFKKPIVVVGQHIASKREDEFLEHVGGRGVCIIDECHILKYDGIITERVRKVKTPNIIGLTGSIPKEPHNKMTMVGIIGKVVNKVTSRELKNRGFKADSRIVGVCIDGGKFINGGVDALQAYQFEREFLLTNKTRNSFIKNFILAACKENVLIPIDLDYHEEILIDTFKDCGREIIVINGKTPDSERSLIYDSLEHKNGVILIVKTGIMREGISINNLSYLIGYFIGKSFVRVVQLLGRIERHGGNAEPVFYDFFDTSPFSKKQFASRLEIYRGEDLRVKQIEHKLAHPYAESELFDVSKDDD